VPALRLSLVFVLLAACHRRAPAAAPKIPPWIIVTGRSLTVDDVAAIADLPSVRAVAPERTSRAQVVAEDSNWNTEIVATTPAYLDVFRRTVASGKPGGVLVGRTVATQLFGGGADPVEHTIRIRNRPFEIAGVLAPGTPLVEGEDPDDLVIVPLDGPPEKIFALPWPDRRDAAEQIRVLLRDRHRLAPDADDDFQLRDLGASLPAHG
jgi:putative ABC transport system permease protein